MLMKTSPADLSTNLKINLNHMNHFAEIAPNIYYVGANDRKTHKFEALWPLPYAKR